MSLHQWRWGRTAKVICLLTCLVTLGCGQQEYENRLRQSREYYVYLERIETHLSPRTNEGQGIMTLRVPKQFRSIPAPVPVKREDGQIEYPPDNRQPNFVQLEFPTVQLLGAWEAPFDVTLADGTTDVRSAFIYTLGNYWMFASEDASKAPDFGKDLVDRIAAAMEQQPPEALKELHPKTNTYLPVASYDSHTFQPKPIPQKTGDRTTSVNYQVTVYVRENGDLRGAVVVVLPEGVDMGHRLNDRIPMMLDQVELYATKPAANALSGAGSSGPAQNKGSGTPAGF